MCSTRASAPLQNSDSQSDLVKSSFVLLILCFVAYCKRVRGVCAIYIYILAAFVLYVCVFVWTCLTANIRLITFVGQHRLQKLSRDGGGGDADGG